VLLQVGVVVADQTRLWHGAREAAREAVVDPDPSKITQTAESSGLTPLSVSVEPPPAYRSQGRPLTVLLRYEPRSIIPFLQPLLANVELQARATMRIEQP
jgi:hypothetical protein